MNKKVKCIMAAFLMMMSSGIMLLLCSNEISVPLLSDRR